MANILNAHVIYMPQPCLQVLAIIIKKFVLSRLIPIFALPKFIRNMDLIKFVEKEYLKTEQPNFKAGDKVTVHYKIKEGNKERIQLFQGDVIQRRNAGLNATFTVRKISNGVGVERIFPLHSPNIDKIEVNKIGKVRRSRIFYLRGLSGKAARIVEKR
jgi:large subunit ribosomal protein L19